MEKEFTKIIYMKAGDIDRNTYKIEKQAEDMLKTAESQEENFVLKLGINSPVRIIAAEKLTLEGIKKITSS